MSRSAAIARYADQDDASLAAMAGEGLLRRARKDLQADRVRLLDSDPSDGSLQLSVDELLVTLDVRGWEHCSCSCPAPNWCKHKLAATLYVRQLKATDPVAEAAADDPAEGTPVGAEQSPALTEILALDPNKVLAEAGIAARRRLLTLLAEAGVAEFEIAPASVVIVLPGLPASIRYLRHGGFAGMYSEGPQSQRKALHLTALWLLWQSHGRSPKLPNELAAGEAAQLSDGDLEAFLGQVQARVLDLLSQGLGHLSAPPLAGLQALNIDARSAALPALAARLRTLEAWAQRLAERDDTVRESEVLALIATTWASCEALRQADSLTRVAFGGGRRQFSVEADAVELIVVGAHWWQRAAGARGLSLYFMALGDGPYGGQILSAAHARADASDSSFEREHTWGGATYWPGLGSAEQIVEAGSLQLQGARISADCRIALGSGVTGQLGKPRKLDETRAIGIDDWEQLGTKLRDQYRLFGPAIEHLLLRPNGHTEPQLDEINQCVRWVILDAQNRPLTLSLPCGSDFSEELNALEYWSQRDRSLLVLVSVEREPELTLRPISLMVNDRGCWRSRPLQFSRPQRRRWFSQLSGRIQRMLAERRAPPAAPPNTLAARLLLPVLEVLITQATSGRQALPDSAAKLLAQRAMLLNASGLELVGKAVSAFQSQPTAEHLLRLRVLIQIAVGLSETDQLVQR